MQRQYAWLLGSLLTLSGSYAASPEIAYVATQQATLRSGPGHDFFPTERIPWGTRLEVYEQVNEQWCAVRPPTQSFSWVLGSAVTISPQDPGQGVVHESGVVVRVGGHLSDRDDVESVTLKRGEKLQILGSESRDVEGEPQLWLKIAPPSGEFRWIHRDALQATPPHFEAKTNRRSGPKLILPRATTAESRQETPQAVPPASDEASAPAAGTAAPSAAAASPVSPDVPAMADDMVMEDLTGSVIAVGATEAEGSPREGASDKGTSDKGTSDHWHAARSSTAAAEEPVGASSSSPLGLDVAPQGAPQSAASATPEPPPLLPDTLDDASPIERQLLQQVAAQLDSMVSEPTRTWALDDLAAKVQAIATATDDPALQADALDLLASIDRFQTILQRHQQLTANRAAAGAAPALRGAQPETTRPTLGPVDPVSSVQRFFQSAWSRVAPYRMASGGAPPAPQANSAASNLASLAPPTQFDGSGWLTTVYSTRSGVPRYALRDREGSIFQFVEPQPGLNLRPYLSQQVGIYGKQRQAPDLNKSVLTAERIVVLPRR